MNPYAVLGVSPNASDAEIRQAYLEAVRRFPPEHAPDRFKAVSQAYEKLRDETARLQYLLFDRDLPGRSPLDAAVQFLTDSPPPKPLDFESMKTFLRTCTTTK